MAFLWRMSRRQTGIIPLCSQLKRTYLQLSSPCLSTSNNRPTTSSNHYQLNEGFCNVRFYAAPIQHKKVETKQKGPRMNDQIKSKSDKVRLVVGEGHEVVPLHVAIERAKRLKHDLVEVDRNADPIVCKIMDYHRERQERKAHIKERSKSKADSTVRKGPSKEVRFSPKIEQKDLEMKADMARRLMERGYRVKCMVLGTEKGLGELIDRLRVLIEDVAIVESGPLVEKSQAYMVVRHMKFGPPKKGGGKGRAKAASSGSEKDTHSQSTDGPSISIQDPADHDLSSSEDSDSENDYDNSFPGGSDSPITTPPKQDKMNSWSLSGADGADKNLFDFIADSENVDTSSVQRNKSLLESAPPNVIGPGSNTPENRYIRQGLTKRAMPAAAERYMQPGPGRAWMPEVPSGADSSENRYSRQGSTRRPPSGSGQYVRSGPDPKGFNLPPRSETPKQNSSTSDRIPSSTSFGIFSNPKASPSESQFGRESTKPRP